MNIQVPVFWVMTPFGDAVGYQRFGESCCLRLQGEGGDLGKKLLHLHKGKGKSNTVPLIN
jgi:hypothetical protein